MIKEGGIASIKATGKKVRILGVDSDESCAVWVVFVDNPERDAMVPRADLVTA